MRALWVVEHWQVEMKHKVERDGDPVWKCVLLEGPHRGLTLHIFEHQLIPLADSAHTIKYTLQVKKKHRLFISEVACHALVE